MLFVGALTEKLMMYAVNRQLEYFDMPQVRKVVRNAEKDNYTLSSLVLGIVNTDAFRKQGPESRSEDGSPDRRRSQPTRREDSRIPRVEADKETIMFITKKHISRRTILKGAGVNLALPFLSAMVPASTALAQTAANPKIRAGFFYIPHGAIMFNTKFGPEMDRWTPGLGRRLSS